MSEAEPQGGRSTNIIQGGQGLTVGPLTSATYQDPSEAEHKRKMEADEAEHLRKIEDDEREHAHKKELAEI
jgi:hypothetical protein